MDFLLRFKVGEWTWFIVLTSYVVERLIKGDTEGLMVWVYVLLYLGGMDSE
jgi:hypothetical protein